MQSRSQDRGGTLKCRGAPAPLWKYVEQVADADDREQFDEGSLEYWPGSVHDLLSDYRVAFVPDCLE